MDQKQPTLAPFTSFSHFLNNPNPSCSVTSPSSSLDQKQPTLIPFTSFSHFLNNPNPSCSVTSPSSSLDQKQPTLIPFTSFSHFLNNPNPSCSVTSPSSSPDQKQPTLIPFTSFSHFLNNPNLPCSVTSPSSGPAFTSFPYFENNLSSSSSSSSSSSFTSFPFFNDDSDSYNSSLSSNCPPPPPPLPPPPPQARYSLSSSSSSTTSLCAPQWRYDVFVSFRGKDTRKTFTSHLFHAFTQAKISFFKDNDTQTLGFVVEKKLIEAIHNSRIALIVFSKNYAESRWCLNELIEILVCNEKRREEHHVVIPIFYDVKPGEVRKVDGSIGEGFAKCKNTHQDVSESLVQKWKDALVEAGNLSGFNLKNDTNGDESEFVEMITTELSKKLNDTLFNNFTLNA